MKKINRIVILSVMFVLAFSGCTKPTQPIAAQAIQRGMHHTDSIVDDLARMSKQAAVDKAVLDVKNAKTPEESQKAVEKLATTFEKVGWLLVQYERGRNLTLIGERFIWEQKGIFDIVIDDITKAKDNVDGKNPTTQPVTRADIENLNKN